MATFPRVCAQIALLKRVLVPFTLANTNSIAVLGWAHPAARGGNKSQSTAGLAQTAQKITTSRPRTAHGLDWSLIAGCFGNLDPKTGMPPTNSLGAPLSSQRHFTASQPHSPTICSASRRHCFQPATAKLPPWCTPLQQLLPRPPLLLPLPSPRQISGKIDLGWRQHGRWLAATRRWVPPVGFKLGSAAQARTSGLSPAHTGVPWLTMNGSASQRQPTPTNANSRPTDAMLTRWSGVGRR